MQARLSDEQIKEWLREWFHHNAVAPHDVYHPSLLRDFQAHVLAECKGSACALTAADERKSAKESG